MAFNATGYKADFNENGDFDDSYLLQLGMAQRKNLMYKYLNLQGSGKLIDGLRNKGVAHVHQVIVDELASFMYNNGKGTFVPTINILKCSITKYVDLSLRSRNSGKDTQLPPDSRAIKEMVQTIQSRYEGQSEFVCWEVGRRGILGENLLHICLMLNTKEHLIIARLLLLAYPNLCKDYFIGSQYFGQTPLHMAIINGNKSLVKLLVQIGSPLTRRALGTFFLQDFGIWLDIGSPSRKQYYRQKLDTTFYGEYPVSFAASVGDQESYDCLIEKGASPNVQDTFGNTVLHIVVINNRTEMYRMALRHYKCSADSSVMNYDGLTPLALAASLGQQKVFNEIINLNTVVLWSFSNLTCRVYPLTGLDSINTDGSVDWNSTLMRVVDARTEQHLAMLEEGVVYQLLQEKWRLYAKRKFMFRLGFYITQLIVAGMALYLRPSGNLQPYAENHIHAPNNGDIVRYVAEGLSCVMSVTSALYHVANIVKQTFKSYIKGLKYSALSEIIFLGHLFLILAMACRLVGFIVFVVSKSVSTRITLFKLEETFIIIAVPLLWMGLLFYASAIKLTGPCVTMIIKLLVGDIVRFSIIYSIAILLFGQVFYVLFKDLKAKGITSFDDVISTIVTIFQMTLGEFKKIVDLLFQLSSGPETSKLQVDQLNYIRYVTLGKIIFVIFMIAVPILLLNMLIAMIGRTYNEVFSSSEREWIAIWAKVVLTLERTFSNKDLVKLRKMYSMPFPKKPHRETGLMVIQANDKTNAHQRKRSVANWKKIYRKLQRHLNEKDDVSIDAAAWLSQLTEEINIVETLNNLNISRQSSYYAKEKAKEDKEDITEDDKYIEVLNNLTINQAPAILLNDERTDDSQIIPEKKIEKL